jgi:hypothetical protein
MPNDLEGDTIPKPVGLGMGHRLAGSLPRLYQVISKGSSSFLQVSQVETR